MAVPNCSCHGEAAYWTGNARYKAGGFWRCAVKKRDYQRERYDRDPVHRIEKLLHDNARNRARTLTRKREAI